MINFRNVKILVAKEFLRLKKNPSAITLLVLLAAIALLISLSWTDPESTNESGKCYVVYPESWKNDGWVRYLKKYHHRYDNMEVVDADAFENTVVNYESGETAILIQLKRRNDAGQQVVEVVYRFPDNNENAIAKPAAWFWAAWKQYGTSRVDYEVSHQSIATQQSSGVATTIRDRAANQLDIGLISTMLLLAVQFFTCCHLYVSFASQDRERGTVRALAMSPVSTTDIIVARAIFHQTLGLVVSGVILLIVKPSGFLQPHIWLTLSAVGFAWLSVGTIITTMTKTQSQASMLMFCYMLGGSILFFMASQFPVFALLQNLTFENHAVNLLHTGLDKGYLLILPAAAMGLLTMLWMSIAVRMFNQRGWQG